MKKYLYAALFSVIITPILVFSWGNIKSIWAVPEAIEMVDKRVDDLGEIVKQQGIVQEKLADLTKDIQHRQDKSEAITTLQINTLKELVNKIKR